METARDEAMDRGCRPGVKAMTRCPILKQGIMRNQTVPSPNYHRAMQHYRKQQRCLATTGEPVT